MSDSGYLRRLLVDRRLFLGGLTAGAVAARLVPRAADDAADLAAAQRLYGLDFDAEELAAITERVAGARSDYTALRATPLSFWDAPAQHFDPVPPGIPGPASGERPTFPVPGAAAADVPGREDLAYSPVFELAGRLRAKQVTSRRLTELSLERLATHDKTLHCVVTLLADSALKAADRADAEMAAGRWRGLLHGIPYGAKDLFAWPGAPTTFGAAPFRDQRLDVRATVLERLEQAGAILVAKLSLGALAMGDVWFGGRTRNPWQPEQGSSGSSAGPAAAVAAGLLPFALGTETCGSILSPCHRCGVSGLRPTFGTVSRHGAMPLSWSMDKVGPIARTALDLAIVFDAIRGPDRRDASVRAASFQWAPRIDGLRVGVIRPRIPDRERGSGEERPVRGQGDAGRDEQADLLEFLRENGAEVRAAAFPDFPYDALMHILSAEAATAFDDLTRSPAIDDLKRQDPGAWPSIFRATRFMPAVEYLRASRIRGQLLMAMHTMMQQFDLLVAPRAGNPNLLCTNLTGHPSVSLPCAARGRGAPRSTTLVGKLFDEATLLGIAHLWQQATDHHRGRPI